MVSVLRKSKFTSQPCGARLALVERRLEEIEATRLVRGCCLEIHLVGGDLHHLFFEIDGIAGRAHFLHGRIFVREWRPAHTDAFQMATGCARERQPGHRSRSDERRIVELQRREIAASKMRRIGIRNVVGENPLARLRPVVPSPQHG